MKNFAKTLFLDGFWLKIIALLSMTLDHLAFALDMNIYCDPTFYLVCRNIGRLALPLFCFMIVEGVIHTKSFKRYILSMASVGTLVLIAQVVMDYGMGMKIEQGNIFIDLILGALAIKCLMNKKIWVKLLSLLPLGYGVLSFVFYCFQSAKYPIASYFPYYLRCQYYWYSIVLIILFYLSYLIAKWIINATSYKTNLYYEMLKGSPLYRFLVNSISALMLVVVTLGLYGTSYILEPKFIFWDAGMQNYAIFSGALLLLYSGKRGYNSKWFQYGCYLYYPLHLLALYGIALLLTI
jgi:hypothetical protein